MLEHTFHNPLSSSHNLGGDLQPPPRPTSATSIGDEDLVADGPEFLRHALRVLAIGECSHLHAEQSTGEIDVGIEAALTQFRGTDLGVLTPEEGADLDTIERPG